MLNMIYSLFPVDGGHRAVIFDRFAGVKNLVVGEGTHFFVPWVQRPIIFDIRSRPRNVPTVTGSKGNLKLFFLVHTSENDAIFQVFSNDLEIQIFKVEIK